MTGRHRLEFEVDCDATVAEELFAFLADVIGSHRDLGLYSAGMTPVVEDDHFGAYIEPRTSEAWDSFNDPQPLIFRIIPT
jgi:hypothetical protein